MSPKTTPRAPRVRAAAPAALAPEALSPSWPPWDASSFDGEASSSDGAVPSLLEAAGAAASEGVDSASAGMMVRVMASEDDARELALSLPATSEKPSYGTPGFRVKDRLFARIREERDVLVVWCENEGEKDFLIRAEPGKFFTTPHYDGHAMVLVRLDAVERDELLELVTESWRLRAPKKLVASFDAEAGT